MRKKTFLINLSFFLIFYIIADILFSNFFLSYRVEYKCYKYNENGLFYELYKNCYAEMRYISSIDSFKVFTNENGVRFSGQKKNKSNNNNAFFFGDSQTFGFGSDWKNTFIGIAEKKIDNYSIYNFGVPSYSPSVYLYKLNQMINDKNLKPKKIFVVLDVTDVFDESERWKNIDSNGRPFLDEKFALIEKSSFKKFKRANFKGSRLIANKLRHFSRKLRSKLKSEEDKKKEYKPVLGNYQGGYIYTNFDELTGCNTEQKKTVYWTCGGVEVGMKKIEEKMKKIGKLSKKINAELYMVIFPWPDTLNFGQTEFNWENYADNLCKKSNCKSVINLFPEFEKIKLTQKDWLEKIYLKNDVHLTPMGNEIVAKKILREGFGYID
tara:strand:- start:2783 stop:3922 length:1140 start_codon:yes stop_codon:yes gene_type:complete